MFFAKANVFISLVVSQIIRFSAASSVFPTLTEANPCSQIRNAQFVCIDCRTVGFCSQIKGSWHTVEFGKCEGLLYCDEEEAKGCSFSRECKVPSRNYPPFECQNPGIYPDPYNCRHYHECDANNDRRTYICPIGFGYTPNQGTCSLNVKQSQECQLQQYECKTIGHSNSWPGEPNIFYICMPIRWNDEIVHVPLLYRCPAGMIFTDDKTCVLAQSSSGVVSSTVAKPDDDDAVNCRLNSLLAVGSGCVYTYQKCGDSKIFHCPTGTHFRPETETCVPGKC